MSKWQLSGSYHWKINITISLSLHMVFFGSERNINSSSINKSLPCKFKILLFVRSSWLIEYVRHNEPGTNGNEQIFFFFKQFVRSYHVLMRLVDLLGKGICFSSHNQRIDQSMNVYSMKLELSKDLHHSCCDENDYSRRNERWIISISLSDQPIPHAAVYWPWLVLIRFSLSFSAATHSREQTNWLTSVYKHHDCDDLFVNGHPVVFVSLQKKEKFFFRKVKRRASGIKIIQPSENEWSNWLNHHLMRTVETNKKKRIPSSRRVYSVLIMMFTHTIDKTKMPNKQWIDSFERFSSSLLRLISIGENEQMTTSILQINQECRARMRASQRSMIFPSLTHSRKLIKSSLLFERKSK